LEELATTLLQVAELRVILATTVSRLMKKKKDERTVVEKMRDKLKPKVDKAIKDADQEN